MHQNGQQQTQRIGDDVALTALEALVAVEAPLTTDMRGLDRLAVDDGCRWAGITPCLDAQAAAESVGSITRRVIQFRK